MTKTTQQAYTDFNVLDTSSASGQFAQNTAHAERLASLETNMETVKSDISEIKQDVKNLNRNIYIGIGILIVASVLVPILLNNYFNKNAELPPINIIVPENVKVTKE